MCHVLLVGATCHELEGNEGEWPPYREVSVIRAGPGEMG